MNKRLQTAWNWAYGEYQNLSGLMAVSWDKCVRSHLYRSPAVLSIQETLAYIVENKCSVSRFGDGEIKLVAGQSLAFQPCSEELQKRLKEILSESVPGLLVCLPDIFSDLSSFTPETRAHWKKHLALYRKWWCRSVTDKEQRFGNAFITRCYMMYKDKSYADTCFTGIKQLWKGRHILLLEGEQSRLGVGNDLFSEALSVKRILAPNQDAFRFRNDIIEEVRKYDAATYLVLLALGPTATVLACDLSKNGYQALDIGHVDIEYEWSRMKATRKVPVAGKYVNEAGGAPKVQIDDEVYQNEIICRFRA